MEEKLIPQNIAAEQSVLGALLIDKTAINRVVGKLKKEDFYRPSHQITYEAMLNLHARNIPIDMVTITEELKKMGKYEDVGGVNFITMLANMEFTSANIQHHARIVEEKALLREVIDSGTKLASMGYRCSEGELQYVVDAAQQQLLHLTNRYVGSDYVHIKSIVEPLVDRFGEMVESNETVTGVASGFTDLDELIGGLHPSDFIILAARPSMGKTALALNIAENVALRGAKAGEPAKRIIFFSLEMSSEQLAMRMICGRAGVNITKLYDGFVSKASERSLADVARELQSAPLWLDESTNLTILEMRAKARRVCSKEDIGLIIIDYLQLINGDSRVPREQQIAEISRGVKAMAKELRLPVIVLSQLNRDSEKENRQPRLSDLRESGAIEQDADIVLILSRQILSDKDDKDAQIDGDVVIRDLVVAKHRNGPVGVIPLTFVRSLTRFENYIDEKKFE